MTYAFDRKTLIQECGGRIFRLEPFVLIDFLHEEKNGTLSLCEIIEAQLHCLRSF